MTFVFFLLIFLYYLVKVVFFHYEVTIYNKQFVEGYFETLNILSLSNFHP